MCLIFLRPKKKTPSFIDVNVYTGNIARHKDNITHLIQGHPNGFIIGWNKRVSGKKYGILNTIFRNLVCPFVVQNFNNPTLGSCLWITRALQFLLFKKTFDA